MAFNYTKARATAARLIANFGQRGAILKATPQASGKPVYVAHPVDLVVLDYADDKIDGTRITQKDRQVFVSLSGLAIEITADDRVQDAAGVSYEIVPPVKPLNPAGVTVMVEIQARV